jgi:hypothetical protein
MIPYVELRQWIEVGDALGWWEETGDAPAKTMLSRAGDPSVFYRRVRRLTGCPWSEVKRLGSAWLVGRFAERCRQRMAELSDFAAHSAAS